MYISRVSKINQNNLSMINKNPSVRPTKNLLFSGPSLKHLDLKSTGLTGEGVVGVTPHLGKCQYETVANSFQISIIIIIFFWGGGT